MFIVYDAEAPDPGPQSLADLTNDEIKLLVDVYCQGTGVADMRKVTGFSRYICYEAFTRLEAVRVQLEAAVLADNDITQANAQAAITAQMPPLVLTYVVNQIVANGCSEGTWEDLSASIITYYGE